MSASSGSFCRTMLSIAVPVTLQNLPLTALAGIGLRLSVPVACLIMYLSEDVFQCAVCLAHLRSGRWIRPVSRPSA